MDLQFGGSPTLYGTVISDLGEGRFSETLLHAIGLSVPIDHCSIFHFNRATQVRHVATASTISLEKGVCSAERYAGGLHAYDPMKKFMGNAAQDNPIHLFKLVPERIAEPRYRDNFTLLETVERLSILTRGGTSWYSLNLYRSKTSGRFSQAELVRLGAAAPVLGALAAKHAEIVAARAGTPDNRSIADGLRSLGVLSSREIEVCELTLRGYRSQVIAETLGLRNDTVRTYRKRAYAKLSISSQNELFRLYLEKTKGPQH